MKTAGSPVQGQGHIATYPDAGQEAIVGMVSLGFGLGMVPKRVPDNNPFTDRARASPAGPALNTSQMRLCALEKKKKPQVNAF